MKKLDKQTKILLSLVILFLAFIIGMSFALPEFLVNLQGVNINKLSSCTLNVTIEDENPISLVNTFPMSDMDALKGTPYNVTINKTGDCNDYSYILNMKSSCETCTKTDGKCTIDGKTCDCNNQISSNLIKYYVKNTATGETYIGNDPYKMNIGGNLNEEDTGVSFEILLWIDKEATNSDLITSDGTSKDFCAKLGAEVTDQISTSIIAKQVQTKAISYQYINDAKQTINGITYNDGDNGVFLFDGTDDNGGTYPIYYYRGNVTNNNVLFANLCWKIVRTTSTGGTKLIYNGTPTDGKCNATGTDTQIGKSKFNNKDSSQADVGYMYGTRYTNSNKNMSSITDTYMYGNDVTYSNGTYTLSGKTTTSVGSSWNTDRTTLANGYHYTCLNSTGTCTSVYYITYFGNSSRMYYLTFTGGDTLETAKTKMFSNTNDSAIKTYIDDWYNAHLTDYTSYLENTIFCNDRSFTEETMYAEEEWAMSVDGGPMLSKDTNSTTYSFFGGTGRLFAGKPSLTCPRNEDKLSLSTTNGGTSGYGNNTLTYPVGMLTYDEAMLAGGQTSSNKNYYLYTGQAFWLLSPSGWYDNCANVGRVYSDALVGNSYVDGPDGVRPSVSLQPGTLFLEGEGTMNNPYVVTEYVQLPQ